MIEKGMVRLTQPTLPSLDKLTDILERIWENKWITNNGEFLQKFEKVLSNYLNIKYCSIVTNGTLALMIGLKALDLKGEVITTPFSFIATSNALLWNGLKPVFCDIEERTCTINPNRIEELIGPKTSAILPVHVYGNPCNVKKIGEISKKYNLKVIYDAAHAFNTKINGKTVLNFGDLSILSFHATKVFNTIEGGAIVTNDASLKKHADLLKNFGFVNEEKVVLPGINAKMNEIQAAYGLLELKIIDKEIEKRKKIAKFYKEKLKNIKGLKLLDKVEGIEHSNPYFPIFIDEKVFGKSRDQVYNDLKNNNIYSRKYFYPLISQSSFYKNLPSASPKNLTIAEKISKQVLCLPIYGDIKEEVLDRICNIINEKF